VRSLDLDELRTQWRVTFRSSPPPAFTKGEKGDATAGNLGEFFEPVLGRSFDAGGEFCGFGLAHIN
jgi:hypothetical protein